VAKVRSEIHQKTNGGFLREEDLWTLISDTETGARTVEHQWSYVDPFGAGTPDCGICDVTVETFLSGGADANVKQKLRAILAVR
jgi:hypothetical protein